MSSASATAISRKITHIAAILLLAACAPLERPAPCPVCPAAPKPAPPERARFEPAAFSALPGWANAELLPSLRAFAAGCPKISAASALARACEALPVSPTQADARRFFESAFRAYSVVSPEAGAEGLVTGYYEPILAGSRTRSERFRHPVYGVPEDLIAVDLASLYPELQHLRLRGRVDGRRLVPYYPRAEIEGRVSAPALAWVEDPIELFFLQIQGSGQIELEGNTRIRVGYADQNGHPYRSLGRHLVERGELKLEQASMQGIQSWALANPAKLQEALNYNASYVFFRELPPEGGPIGALGVPLSAGFSIAVDPRHLPLGAPVYLATTFPLSSEPLARLVAAQDTGGAIRGAVRADFFWGSGAEAGALAGRMRQAGRMWLLWPAAEALPGR